MKKEKILFILHLPPPVHGSSMVGQYIKNSVIINEEFEGHYINLGTSKSIEEIGKKPLAKIGMYFSILKKTISELITNKPNLVYFAMTAKGLAFYKDALVIFLIKIFNIPLVLHLHNKGVSLNQERFVDNLLYRFVFKNCQVILLSEHLYSDVQKYVTKDKVFYCPNGIPDIKSANIIPNNSKAETVSILFLSNLIESKGVFVLLEACAILKSKNLDFNCVFIGGIGDVTENQFIAKIKDLDLDLHVIYQGKRYGSEKENAYLNATIFVFPTFYHNETFGLVNLEAMQFSLPVISTFEGGIPDVVEDGCTGFLVPQQNAKALASKIEILIKSPDLRFKMGNAGRLKYENEFTLTVFEERISQILLQVLENKSKGKYYRRT